MKADLRELAIDELSEIIGDDYEALLAHQRATLKHLKKDDDSLSLDLLEVDSFIPRNKYRDTQTKVSDDRYRELMQLCGNTALYDDKLEDAAEQQEILADAITIRQRLPDDQRAINAFRACRSVAILGVALEQQTASISQIETINSSAEEDARVVA